MIAGLLAAALLLPPAQIPDPDPRPPREIVQMAITFEQFFQAIADQESGGDYGAKGIWVGGDRAYGKYQIMGANLPDWGPKYLGFTPSPQSFLDHPDWQEKMARGRLQEYWNKYGARGAAAAWYSGDPNLQNSTRTQYGGMPSVKSYVDDVIATASRMPGGSGGGGSSSGGGGGSSGPVAGPGETAETYGYVEALLQSIPELRSLFKQAVDGGWSPQKFQASLRDTTWFKNTSESERKFLVTQYGDPATAGQMWHTAQIKVQQMGGTLGAYIGWDKINEFAYGIMAKGWTEEQLRQELANYINIDRDRVGGLAGENIQKLRQYAYQMGVTADSSWLQAQARQIAGGYITLEDGYSVLRTMSKGIYDSWKDQIDAGQTVQDLASPYMKSMVGILELPPGSVDLNDSTIKRALQYKDPATGENKIKPIWQFENELRQDDRWKQTKNAQDSVMQVAHQVLSDFGVKY